MLQAGSVGNTGALLAAGNLTAQASGNVSNAGILQAGGALAVTGGGSVGNNAAGTLRGNTLALSAAQGLTNAGLATATAGAATLRVNGTFTNSGELAATQSISIADLNDAATQAVVNSGKLIATQALGLKAASVANQLGGFMQAGSSTVTAGNVSNAGAWLLSTQGGSADAVTVTGTLQNSGTLQSTGAQALAAGTLTNQGTLYAAGNLGITTTAGLTNAGVAQSAQALTVTSAGAVDNQAGGAMKARTLSLATGGTGLNNAGTLTADLGDATLRVAGALTNSGVIHAAQKLDIADRTGGATEAVTNSGTLIADEALALRGAGVSNTASGRVQANTGSTVSAASLANAGTWLLSQKAAAADTVAVTNAFTNSGTLQGAGDATVTAASIGNTGKLLAGGNLTANVATGLTNGGTATVQAGQVLAINGGAAALGNANGGKLLGNGLAINVASLDNAGTVQGGNRSDSAIAVANTLTNQGTGVITLASTAAGAGTVSATRLTNPGRLQSAGALTVKVGSGGFDNAGTTIATGNVTVQSRTAGGDYTADVGGLVQAGGLLSLLGGNSTTWNVGTAGTVMGSTLTGTLNTIALADGGALWSDGAMTLTLGKLSLAGANASVLGAMQGAGLTSISTSQALVNNGLLFSGYDLAVSAPSITNANGLGGIAALHDATVRATTGDVLNQGTFYAGNKMSAYAESGTLTNAASLSAYQGTINAGSQVYLKANTVVNNSTIESNGGITIEATTLRNEVPGGDTRKWGAETAHSAAVETNHRTDYDFPDDHEYWDYQSTWSKSQTYDGGTPLVKPQIIAGGAMQLTFNTAKNLGGVISGNTVNLTGTGTGATFVNDDLALQKTSYKQTWTEHTKYIALGPETYYVRARENDTTTNTVSEISNLGAGIYAKTLTGGGFALTNNGATQTLAQVQRTDTKAATIDTRGGRTETGGSVGAATGAASGANGSNFTGVGDATTAGGKAPTTTTGAAGAQGTSFAGVRTLNGQAAISFLAVNAANGVRGTSFGGINIPLPVNPNGLFVIAKEPGAQYLVESNPRYRVGATSVGSDYLAKQLGYDPDTLVRRLGDASYEAYLIKQQLVAQTGNNLLVGSQDAASQVQRLMDQAAGESKGLGLTYGQALTPEQQANLKQDIVWMVQTEIGGQTVLAPVVYLSAATKAGITQGAVITADTASLSVTSLTNTGGTIAGTKALTIVSVGDVTNTSGTITGGNVAVSSTQGSIVNQTAASGSGNDLRYVTDVGKTATISSTGTLALVAAKDITNKGANVAAGGDATLAAGGSVTFDTVQNKSTDTTRGAYAQDGGRGTTTTTTTTVEQLKSGLTTGGNLAITAAKDITLAGTDTRVGGNADLNAGGNLNIVARENSTTARTESQASGIGMGGSVYGSSTTTTDSTSVRNVGSTFSVGGNANLAAKNDVTVQGSTVDVAGKGSITATNVNVLAGRNYDETTSTTTSTSFLKVTNDGTQTRSQSGSSATAASGKSSASASAGADASTGATSGGGLQLASSSTTASRSTDLKNVGSTLNFGGDVTVNASKDVNLVGSNIATGGNATVNAQNINVVAAKDVATSSSTTTTTSVGLMGSSENNAGASAGAAARASGNVVASASASANAEAKASTDNKLDLVQTSTTTRDTLDITNQGSAITSKGSTTLNAGNAVTVQGSKIAADGDVNLTGKDIRFVAATDVHETRETSNTTRAGLYASGEANASAGANVKAGTNTSADASAKASAGLEVGLYGSNTQTSSVEGSTKAVVSGISAGGNVNRTATNGIVDVGTSIEAGGNLTQSAKTITSLAAADTTYASSSSTSNTAKIGAYGEAEAGVSAKASLTGGANKVENDVSAGAGIRATYEYEKEGSQSASSKAVVSNIKVGGNVSSTSSGATTLEGTNIAAGKDVTLGASSLQYTAAKDTASASSDSTKAGASVGVDIVNKSVSVGGSYEGGKENSASSTAVVGNMAAGGNLTVKTTGDAKFEGTNLAAGGAASVDAGGSVVFDAAKNTSSASGQNMNASAGITAGKKGASVEAEGGYSQAKSSGSDAVAGSISSGGPLSVKSGGDTTFTGTALSSGGDTTVAAGGNLAFNAARSTSSSEGFGVSASVQAEGGKSTAGGKTTSTKGGGAGVEASYSMSQSDSAAGATLASGGNITLSSGKNTTLEGTQARAAGAVAVGAGGTVDIREARSTSTSVDVGIALAGSGSSSKTTGGATGGTAGSAAGTRPATPAGAASPAAAPEAPKREGSGGLDLNVSMDKSSQATKLEGGQGVTVSSNVKPAAAPLTKEAKAAEAKAKADKAKADRLAKEASVKAKPAP
ncbi:MAG: hypothetical protein EOO26_01490 [Comamonadaceae bacterium]|nr:MAG: hypothetical protein EOO26_01490 [Comamonadaceae bacterium]